MQATAPMSDPWDLASIRRKAGLILSMGLPNTSECTRKSKYNYVARTVYINATFMNG
jgi:hypothetical protein